MSKRPIKPFTTYRTLVEGKTIRVFDRREDTEDGYIRYAYKYVGSPTLYVAREDFLYHFITRPVEG